MSPQPPNLKFPQLALRTVSIRPSVYAARCFLCFPVHTLYPTRVPPSQPPTEPLTEYLIGDVPVPPVAASESQPLNWWALDLDTPSSMRDPRSAWSSVPRAIPPSHPAPYGASAGASAGAGKGPSSGAQHQGRRGVPRGSLPSAAEGRLEFAVLRNAIADDDDDMDEDAFIQAAAGVCCCSFTWRTRTLVAPCTPACVAC
jgi:hypothetical protein